MNKRSKLKRTARLFLILLLCLIPCKAWATDYTQDANAVATYLLNETSGNAIDSTNSYDATLNGGVTQGATGQFGNAYDFAGDNDYLSCGNVNNDSPYHLSIVSWVYLGSYVPWNAIVQKHVSEEREAYAFGFDDDNGKNLMYICGSTADWDLSRRYNSTELSLETFTHVAICASASAGFTYQFYLNGVADGNGNQAGPPYCDQNYPVYIGVDFVGGDEYFDGKIDEVGIFQDILDSTEINDIMDNGLVGGGAQGIKKGLVMRIL